MISRFSYVVITVCILLTALNASVFAESKTVNYVTIERGELPIILSAPHGGKEKIANAKARLGENVRLFNAVSDSGTAQITEKLADAIEKKLGKRPYVVIARFHRKYADANRRASDSYESAAAKPAYDTFHEALANARQEVMERFGHGVLFDIHGQGAAPKSILRGTRDGKTTKHLISRFGRDAVFGKSSLFGRLAEQGVSVSPAIDSTAKENPKYNGGYIVATYGSDSGGTVDAIQLELGKELRALKNTDKTVKFLVTAIAQFAEDYLPKQEQNIQEQNIPVEKAPSQARVMFNNGLPKTPTEAPNFFSHHFSFECSCLDFSRLGNHNKLSLIYSSN